MDLTTHPKIIEINHRLDKVEAFQEYCKVNHASHTAEDAVQKLIAEKHLELINKTIATQENMANSVNSLSISMNSISKFIKDNEKILELIVSIATGFRGLKKSNTWNCGSGGCIGSYYRSRYNSMDYI